MLLNGLDAGRRKPNVFDYISSRQVAPSTAMLRVATPEPAAKRRKALAQGADSAGSAGGYFHR
jgi:hypothetical protein